MNTQLANCALTAEKGKTFAFEHVLILNPNQSVYPDRWFWLGILFRACWYNAYSWPLWKINTALSNFVVASPWNIENIIVAEHQLLSCWLSAWKKRWNWTKTSITFSNKGAETARLETTESSFNLCVVLWTVCGQGWPSQTQTPPSNIYLHQAIPSA